MIRVGLPSYTNSLLFAEGLKGDLNPLGCDLEQYVPSTINSRFSKGLYDFALVSSVQVIKENLPFLPYGIASKKEVMSVILFTKRAPKDLAHTPIGVTPESATSLRLLKLLAKKHWQIDAPIETMDKPCRCYEAFLLIGDSALTHYEGYERIDLAQVWNSWTALPFVFALFAHRGCETDSFGKILREIVKRMERDPKALIKKAAASSSLAEPLVANYLSKLSFQIDEEALEGFNLFKRWLIEEDLL